MTRRKTATAEEVVSKEPKYSKSAVLESNQFNRVEKDFLHAYLEDGAAYTLPDVRALLNKKLKGAVK